MCVGKVIIFEAIQVARPPFVGDSTLLAEPCLIRYDPVTKRLMSARVMTAREGCVSEISLLMTADAR